MKHFASAVSVTCNFLLLIQRKASVSSCLSRSRIVYPCYINREHETYNTGHFHPTSPTNSTDSNSSLPASKLEQHNSTPMTFIPSNSKLLSLLLLLAHTVVAAPTAGVANSGGNELNPCSSCVAATSTFKPSTIVYSTAITWTSSSQSSTIVHSTTTTWAASFSSAPAPSTTQWYEGDHIACGCESFPKHPGVPSGSGLFQIKSRLDPNLCLAIQTNSHPQNYTDIVIQNLPVIRKKCDQTDVFQQWLMPLDEDIAAQPFPMRLGQSHFCMDFGEVPDSVVPQDAASLKVQLSSGHMRAI
jgi:hypothetical protein